MRLFLFTALLLFGATSAEAGDQAAIAAARQVVERYCQIEFEGGGKSMEEREQVIKFSPKREKQISKETGMGAHVDYSNSHDIVVSVYEVKDVRLTGTKRATATVAFKRLARTEGDTYNTQHYVAEPAHEELVTLNLVFDQKQWWVLDPPTPRVSKQVLIKRYEDEVKEDSSKWERILNDPSYEEEVKANVRAGRDRATSTLRILKELP